MTERLGGDSDRQSPAPKGSPSDTPILGRRVATRKADPVSEHAGGGLGTIWPNLATADGNSDDRRCAQLMPAGGESRYRAVEGFSL